MAGSRCSIYEAIDKIDEATTVKELAAAIRPVLDKLAYYMIQSEGVALEDQEAWHEEFTDRLYTAAEQDHNAALAQERGRTGAREPKAKPAGPDGQRAPLVSRPPPGRARPAGAGLSPSLQAIMNGTHPSLTEHD